MAGQFDPLVLGHRVRHFRTHAGLTLAEVGARVGRPASYLSQLENGKVEPKLSLLDELASSLGTTVSELLDTTPPTRRAELEVAYERLRSDPAYLALGLPELRVGAKLSDEVLEHLVSLASRLPDDGGDPSLAQRASDRSRKFNSELRREMRSCDNYFADIEHAAREVLHAVGYAGQGPVSERLITDIARHFGFTVERVHSMPRTARSITDQRARVIYIPERDALKIRQARSVVLQTLGHFALDHATTENFEDYLRQRIESNYFAGAVLAPESAAVDVIGRAVQASDVSIEDVKETFYVSYEMAAHRFTNLAMQFFDIPVHFLRTDSEGVITKAYENDGIPLPVAPDGSLEGERVSRLWGCRQAWNSTENFLLHYQYTLTDGGEFWCVTYIESETGGNPIAITLGTDLEHAPLFRGSETIRRVDSRGAVTRPDPGLIDRWEGIAWPSAAERSHVLTALPLVDRSFTPFPGVDLIDVYRFLERHR